MKYKAEKLSALKLPKNSVLFHEKFHKKFYSALALLLHTLKKTAIMASPLSQHIKVRNRKQFISDGPSVKDIGTFNF